MNKIAQYLNEHIVGEVTDKVSVRQSLSHDKSLLKILPELVVFPRNTNDIRKVARFCWQLAEKGHTIPITVRGIGADRSGAAIGRGIIIDSSKHLNKVLYIESRKDSFVHLQCGTDIQIANSALEWYSLFVPFVGQLDDRMTIGGIVCGGYDGIYSGQYGRVYDYIDRLEVILANGDVIESSRINKHELSNKKGLQTFEGEIYRQLDGLIDDNKDLIKKIADSNDKIGYSGIVDVKRKDGSFDLTPLIVGSQGTLGIVSEAMIKTVPYNKDRSYVALKVDSLEKAIDASEKISTFGPLLLNIIDSSYFSQPIGDFKKYVILNNGETDDINFRYLVIATFNDMNKKTQFKKIKKIRKILSKEDIAVASSIEYEDQDFLAIQDIIENTIVSSGLSSENHTIVLEGSMVDVGKLSELKAELVKLEDKIGYAIPFIFDYQTGRISVSPIINTSSVSDKQKMLKITTEFYDIIKKLGGVYFSTESEGRWASAILYNKMNSDIIDLYENIKKIFDPYVILNEGVKQPAELRTLIEQLPR